MRLEMQKKMLLVIEFSRKNRYFCNPLKDQTNRGIRAPQPTTLSLITEHIKLSRAAPLSPPQNEREVNDIPIESVTAPLLDCA